MPLHHSFTCHARLYAGHPWLHKLGVEKWIAGMKPAMTGSSLVPQNRTIHLHVMPGPAPGIQTALPLAGNAQ
jgi:hypothetical protein